jgi:hypothetical protein
MDDIDAYDELRSLMRDLERRGVPVPDIIDCSFRLSLGASRRFFGPQATAASLIDMAMVVADQSMPVPGRLH